jgi:hypothetical protein
MAPPAASGESTPDGPPAVVAKRLPQAGAMRDGEGVDSDAVPAEHLGLVGPNPGQVERRFADSAVVQMSAGIAAHHPGHGIRPPASLGSSVPPDWGTRRGRSIHKAPIMRRPNASSTGRRSRHAHNREGGFSRALMPARAAPTESGRAYSPQPRPPTTTPGLTGRIDQVNAAQAASYRRVCRAATIRAMDHGGQAHVIVAGDLDARRASTRAETVVKPGSVPRCPQHVPQDVPNRLRPKRHEI